MSKLANKYQREHAKKHGFNKTETRFRKERARRYYLHGRLKGFIKLQAEKRIIFVPVGTAVPSTLQNYINELSREYGYSVQMVVT